MVAGLSLSAGCWQNLLAEKEVIAGAAGFGKQSLGKEQRTVLDYARTII